MGEGEDLHGGTDTGEGEGVTISTVHREEV